MKSFDSIVLPKNPDGSKNFIPVNAAYHAEERCERLGVPYNANYEKLCREMANDSLGGV